MPVPSTSPCVAPGAGPSASGGSHSYIPGCVVPSLPSQWFRERLRIRTAGLADVPALRSIYNACRHLEPLDPTFSEASEEAIRDLVSRSLACAEDASGPFHLQSIHLQAGAEPLGYFHLSYSQPHPETVWISMFVLHPMHQRSGYGAEAVRGLLAELRSMGMYRAVWLRVYLKNWAALRFWIRTGFTEIVQYDGASVPGPDAVASLVLAHRLREVEAKPKGAT
jgi:diamine N-acetyltransferase